MKRITVLVMALALLPAGQVQAAGEAGVFDAAAESARIAAERQAVEARFAEAQAACRVRFQVNACLQEARAERRAALEPLQRQQLMLDDLRRRERAAARLRAIQDRVREQAPKPPQAAVRVREAASAPAGTASRPGTARPAPTGPSVMPAAAPPTRHEPDEVGAQRARRQHAERQKAAQEHAEAVRQRNALRDARRPPAAGLPLPAASATSP